MGNVRTQIAVIGAGPAGLTAAYLLSKEKWPTLVLEADPHYVGGISKTISYKGFLFDIGGHRFFSKSQEVEDLWSEILPNDMLERTRSSKIYYKERFYHYPLQPLEALFNLGLQEAALCIFSYLYFRLFPRKNPKNFEDWVSNQFGARLFRIFFKTYTEKVWGMDCKEISADWAAQRIKGLSLFSAIANGLLPKRKSTDRSQIIKTLIDSFRYPRKGPGMMWEEAARKMQKNGGVLWQGWKPRSLSYEKEWDTWIIHAVNHAGESRTIECNEVISSAALGDLMPLLQPKVPDSVIQAAHALRYRDFLVVTLIVRGENERFQDNWIYIHDPSVKVGRIQNFKAWSPEMVPDPSLNCYGLEYFCFAGDGLWNATDAELLERAKTEIVQLGLATREDILDGCVVRQAKAYPVYDDAYAKNVNILKSYMAQHFPTFHFVGRNGMHKYNNQDHAMMTAMLAVRNILAGRALFDVWTVSQDAEYNENEVNKSHANNGLRFVPERINISH